MQRTVPVNIRVGNLDGEDVREHVRKVARQRDDAIVGGSVDHDRACTDRRHERMQRRESCWLRFDRGRQEVGCTGEQLGPRVCCAMGLRATDRVTTNKAPTSCCRDGGNNLALR